MLAGAAWSCDESVTDVGPTPNLQPTLSSIQREIFNTTDSRGRPACINCHTTAGGRVPDGPLILQEGQSYGQLVNRGSVGAAGAVLVIPGDPNNSYLIRKLEGASSIAGVRMPNGGPYLTTGQIDVIRQWIQMGARND